MHNNIMAAGSKDRPPMLGPGRYSQWRSRFLRYIDTKPNGEGLRKSILSGPYIPSTVLVQAVAATEGNPAIQQHTTIETVLNMTPENKEHFLSEKEAIFLLLTGIGDDIYSTVDACKTTNEMWIAIERLQQGESLNVQDVKTNLFWEFGKFTSRDGESMESYYSRFYKLMNELTRNNLQVTTMQVNVQFLQQLQPEWSRFVTVVKQSKEIDTISYHTLFDILKQYQNEVNDIRAERIAKSANPLALLAAAQPYSDNYYQAPKPQRSNATSSSTRPSASTRHKGKEIAKPVTPQSESVSEEDSDPEQAQRDKDMQKNLALLAKYFKKLYKPTNNNLRTSSNFRNKTEDTTPRYNNDNQSGQFRNPRTMIVAGARETVGSQVVQQNGIQCFNCKGFGHYAKECRKPKRVKDYTYHKEKMMMCKQAEHGVPLQAEQADWLADTDEEIDEQELEAHYSFMAKIQVLIEESNSTEQPLEQVQNNDENNVFANARQHSENNTAECADERVALANLIANLTLDTEENKTILKQLKKANASLTQELEECKTNLDETSRALGEATSCRDSCLIALQNKQNELEKYIAFNDRTIDYDILQTKLNETLGLLARKDIDIKEGLKTKAYEISVVNQKHDEFVKRSLLTKSQFEGLKSFKCKHELAISELKENSLRKARKGKSVETQFDKPSVVRQPNAQRIPKPSVLGKPTPFLNSPKMRSFQMKQSVNKTNVPDVKDKVVPNNSQVKFKKKEVEDHHRISSISKKTKSVTTCNDSSNSRTSNVNVVCAECGKCVFNSNHDACVSRYLNDVNARTKKPNVVPISASKPKRKANKSVATPHKKTVASDTTIQKSKSYYKELYENTNQEWKWWIAKRCPSGYTWTQKPLRTKKIWMPKIRKDDVSTSISPIIDIVSRIAIVLKISNSLGSNLSNVPSSSNSLADCTVHFGNDQFAPILGYGDLNQGNITIKRVYYVEGLNHNLFSVGQFCDADLEVAFRKSTCFVRDLQGNDLLTGNHGSDLYTISLQETTSSTPICFMAKASPTQAWLWHRRLSHLNFDYITLLSKKDIVTGLPKLKYVKDQLCSSCEMSKAKRSSFKSKAVPSSKGRLNLLHMDLCGPMRVASINGKKYILVIVDDYSRYTWTLFLRSKDETPEVLKDFLTMIQRNLQAQVISVRTDRGTCKNQQATLRRQLALIICMDWEAMQDELHSRSEHIKVWELSTKPFGKNDS
ncbi:retrovirus-related pol polyprotein from transposon TNT 1-94 [Tanacetum coccineum]